jgi:cell division protein ZapA (FtsZ GTPase activity inhibitor)
MGELSIKVNIANRIYPLKINREEEENIRLASKTINDILKDYEENYAVRDKQDLLAMCALKYASEALKKDNTYRNDSLNEHLSDLSTILNDFLIKELKPA